MIPDEIVIRDGNERQNLERCSRTILADFPEISTSRKASILELSCVAPKLLRLSDDTRNFGILWVGHWDNFLLK